MTPSFKSIEIASADLSGNRNVSVSVPLPAEGSRFLPPFRAGYVFEGSPVAAVPVSPGKDLHDDKSRPHVATRITFPGRHPVCTCLGMKD